MVGFVGGFGWFWLVLLVVLGGFGWFWLVLGGFGWFWLVPWFSNYAICCPFSWSSTLKISQCNGQDLVARLRKRFLIMDILMSGESSICK